MSAGIAPISSPLALITAAPVLIAPQNSMNSVVLVSEENTSRPEIILWPRNQIIKVSHWLVESVFASSSHPHRYRHNPRRVGLSVTSSRSSSIDRAVIAFYPSSRLLSVCFFLSHTGRYLGCSKVGHRHQIPIERGKAKRSGQFALKI